MTTIAIDHQVRQWPETVEVTTHVCRECGTRFNTRRWVEDVAINMSNRSLCFDDNFWYDLWLLRDQSNIVRIDGQHYTVSSGKQKGFGGDKFTIKRNDGLQFTTDNLWHQGVIPENWRTRLPDNAKFIKE